MTEVALRVIFVRALVDHSARALAGEPTAEIWQRAGMFEPLGDPFDDEALENADVETASWWHFADMLNNGLSAVSPRLVPPEILPDIGDIVSSYAAACVLVFNDLFEGIPYRRCADETCGRIFRRQLGRSSGAFSRSEGVAYCTPTHARNQAQRERRRRERANRSKGE